MNAKREEVRQRKVSIAFPLKEDEEELEPLSYEESAWGGIYSFLPLGRERTGVPFLIHSDFIVHPGRGEIDYEAKWNEHLLREIENLAEEVAEELQNHLKWRTTYRRLFDFKEYPERESYRELFGPYLVDPLSRFIKEKTGIPVRKGGTLPIEKVAKAEPYSKVFDLLGGEKGLQEFLGVEGADFLHPSAKLRKEEEQELEGRKITPLGIAKNKGFLEKVDDPEWFCKLYKEIKKQSPRKVKDIYILTEDKELALAEESYFNTLPEGVEKLRREKEEVKKALEGYPLLHHRLEQEMGKFLEANAGVSRITYERLCRDVFLPKIKVTKGLDKFESGYVAAIAPEYTDTIRRAGIKERLWVLTKDNSLAQPEDVYLGKEYSPEVCWEDYSEQLPKELNFLSRRYLDESGATVEEWRNFFLGIGVKGKKGLCNLARKEILPRLSISNTESLSESEILVYTELIQQLWSKIGESIWVLTKDGSIQQSNKVLFSSEYQPKWNWEANSRYTPRKFLSANYTGSPDRLYEFFKSTGVADEASSDDSRLVEDFAINFTIEELGKKHGLSRGAFNDLSKQDVGYDLEVNINGVEKHLEVKGRSSKEIIELPRGESRTASKDGGDYWLCIVYEVPERPSLYLVEDPASVGRKERIVVPKEDWQKFKLS